MSLPRAPYPENGIAYAHQGDTALGPVLPHGTRVILPAPAAIRLSPVRRTINLWD